MIGSKSATASMPGAVNISGGIPGGSWSGGRVARPEIAGAPTSAARPPERVRAGRPLFGIPPICRHAVTNKRKFREVDLLGGAGKKGRRFHAKARTREGGSGRGGIKMWNGG